MPHPLDEWLPNDAPWATLDMAVLRKQCAIRDLLTAGETEDLIQRLRAYRHANPNTCAIKRCHPWRTEPVDRTWYRAAALEAEKERFQIVRVVDKPGRKRDSLRRDFQICDSRLWPKYAGVKRKHITVSIDTALKCDCPSQVGQSLFYGHCAHIIYILRFVLNCPEPYRWQRALLPSELRTIYQHSHAIRAFGPNHPETRHDFCILCFKECKEARCCQKCKRRMHPVCSSNAAQVRTPMREGTCWICYDNIEWSLEKFRWNDRALPAAPSTAPAVPVQTGPAADVIQESIQREEPEDKQPNNTPSIERRLPFFADEEDSESESSDEDDMLLDVGSLVKGIGAPAATSERPRLSLFSMSRPEGESSGICLPKVKRRAFHTKAFLENDSQDDTNYEALAMSSPRKQSKTGEVDEQNSEDDAIGKKVNAAPSLSSSSSSSNSLSSLASTVNQQVPSSAHRRVQPPRESGTKALQAPRESGPLSASIHTNESIPLPGIPSLIWQEMREQREQREQSEKQQREKARQQAAPFAIPANNNGMPLIRRDSTKPDSRANRPGKPAHPKDLVYDTKRKKKLIPELQFCEEVLTELRNKYYEFNKAFQKPVDPVALNIPTYHKIIKKPMDLSTMQKKLNTGDYANAKEFERDFELMIKNCRLFNREQHPIYKQALRLQSLYRREMSKKDKWLAKHTPTPAPHHSSNLPKPSAALGHALPTLNPGGGEPLEVTISPDAARIPAGDHNSPHASSSAAVPSASTAITATLQHNQAGATSISGHDASVADAVSQAPQSGVTTASSTEPAAATDAQHTTSINTDNPASASAPVPPDHSASAPTHGHSGTQTTIDHTKALELVQECSHLAKKSVQMRKKSEREAKRMEKKHRRELKKITKMEKKHRRELKKTKRKSKQEIKRLEKKIESLEKEVLKALARPEVAEGTVA